MMLYPPMSVLAEKAGSRYLLVNVIARRARQISIESEITHEPLTDKPVTIAMRAQHCCRRTGRRRAAGYQAGVHGDRRGV